MALTEKIILVFTFCAALISCTPHDAPDLEKHELEFIMVDYNRKEVLMHDITDNSWVTIKYSYELFLMEWVQVCQIKGNPIYTFFKSNNNYYRL